MIVSTFLKTRAYFDDGGNSPPPPPPPPSPPPSPPPPPPGAVTFTEAQQNHINRLMAEQKRKIQDDNKQLVTQLEELRSKANLTQQEKDALDARIEALNQAHLTKEQQLAADLDKAGKKYKTDTEALTAEGTKWRTNFNNMLVENAIRAGATKHTAASVNQMLDLLKGKAKVVEELDDAGKPTGNFLVKLPMLVEDPKTKKPVLVELDMIEGIGKMREVEENANLFLTDGRPGYGGQNGAKGGGSGAPPDFAKMTPEQYSKWRKEQGYGAR